MSRQDDIESELYQATMHRSANANNKGVAFEYRDGFGDGADIGSQVAAARILALEAERDAYKRLVEVVSVGASVTKEMVDLAKVGQPVPQEMAERQAEALREYDAAVGALIALKVGQHS